MYTYNLRSMYFICAHMTLDRREPTVNDCMQRKFSSFSELVFFRQLLILPFIDYYWYGLRNFFNNSCTIQWVSELVYSPFAQKKLNISVSFKIPSLSGHVKGFFSFINNINYTKQFCFLFSLLSVYVVAQLILMPLHLHKSTIQVLFKRI